jgi:hypothetical protein
MKRAILISLVLIFATLTPPSAQAIFGLSKCEKAKKQLSVIENSLITTLASVGGNEIEAQNVGWGFFRGERKPFILNQRGIATINKLTLNDPIPKIWKLAFNNPNCFTRTQNLQVAELKMQHITNYVNETTGELYRLGPKCEFRVLSSSGYGKVGHPKGCTLGVKTFITTWVVYQSIYDY